MASLMRSTGVVLASSVDLPYWGKVQHQSFIRAEKAAKNQPVLSLPLPSVVSAAALV